MVYGYVLMSSVGLRGATRQYIVRFKTAPSFTGMLEVGTYRLIMYTRSSDAAGLIGGGLVTYESVLGGGI